MRVAYISNTIPPHSTENELRRALIACGHPVDCYQENEPGIFTTVARRVERYDVVLWTRTPWRPAAPHDEQRAMLAAARDAGVPTVGYHLDRWWGLDRETEVATEPYFGCSLMVTADGGHDERWRAAGIEHRWFPPAVSAFECEPGTPRDEYRSDVAFVGTWRGYHREWAHRQQLVEHLRRRGAAVWPAPGRPAVREAALRDLYASVSVLVGDSCLAGGATSYLSDRIPETLGRGGFLIHPHVIGVTDGTLYTAGTHLATWPLDDWAALDETIAYYLKHEDERRAIADAGRRLVLAEHTYTRRVEQLKALLDQRLHEAGGDARMVPEALSAVVEDG